VNYDRPELLDRLAAAQVFGTLARLPRRRFARLARELPAASAALARWERHAAALSASVPAVPPSPTLWRAIEARTGAVPAAVAVRRRPWWASILGPSLAFSLGLFLAVGLVRLYPEAVLAPAPPAEALPASYVGLLLDAAGQPAVLASSRRHGRELSVKMLRPVTIPPGQVLRLWALPKEGAPFALGELPASGKGALTLSGSSEELLSAVPRLGASLEDAGPAPARPGPFLLQGHCVKLW
jgi:anti-sigma-K factor RskA